MLVLSRRQEESVIIDKKIKITVLDIQGDKVRIGFDAPKDIKIWREEINDRINKKN